MTEDYLDELKRYKDFFAALVEHFGAEENLELDYSDFTDLGVRFGFISWVGYDPDKHGEMDVEPGDPIWVWSKE